ncbi:MAG: ABC transporter permease [Acidimicrobiia bacterium]
MPELIESTAIEAATGTVAAGTRTRNVWQRLRRRIGFWVGVALLAPALAMAVAPALVTAASPASSNPRACSLRAPDGSFQDRQGPSRSHWFGTDLEGCDEFAKVVAGARPTLAVGLLAAVVAFALALVVGGAAGLGSRRVDATLSRFTDVWFGFPAVIGAILILSSLGDDHGVVAVGAVLGILAWPVGMRIFRASVQRVRSAGYIDVARVSGASSPQLLFRHVVPNAWGPLLVYGALSFGILITAESTLTFLGVGLGADTVSWGRMIAEAEARFASAPHLILFPGAMLTMVVLGAVLVADALQSVTGRGGAQ